MRSYLNTPLTITVLVLMSGCAITARDAIMYHSFNYPGPTRHGPATIPGTLMIYRFQLKPDIDADYLTVTGAEDKDQPVDAHRWSRSPSDMIGDLMERDFTESAIFEKIIGHYSDDRYRYALEGKVTDIRGVRAGEKTTALIEVEATLTDFGVPLGADKTLLKKTYRIEVPAKNATPAAIVDALNLAIKKFSQELRSDVAATLRTKGRSKSAA